MNNKKEHHIHKCDQDGRTFGCDDFFEKRVEEANDRR